MKIETTIPNESTNSTQTKNVVNPSVLKNLPLGVIVELIIANMNNLPRFPPTFPKTTERKDLDISISSHYKSQSQLNQPTSLQTQRRNKPKSVGLPAYLPKMEPEQLGNLFQGCFESVLEMCQSMNRNDLNLCYRILSKFACGIDSEDYSGFY